MQVTDIKAISAPCNIALSVQLADNTTLTMHEIVRVVPEKRLVCKGVWQGQAVYAKLFLGKHAQRYARRDAAGVGLLVTANIATPELLYAEFESTNSQITDAKSKEAISKEVKSEEVKSTALAFNSILVFAALTNAQNAEQLYHDLLTQASVSQPNVTQSKPRLQLMLQLTQIIAQLHNAGLQQTDLHFKNFLVDKEKVYAIDGDGVRPFTSLCKKRQQQRNLATLLSKMDVLDSAWVRTCYRHYCQLTGTQYSTADELSISNLTQQLRQKSASAYADKKVFRTCTDVKVAAKAEQFIALAAEVSDWDLSAALLDSALGDLPNRLKSGNTCTVAKAVLTNQTVVIKRYNIKSVWHGLSRMWRPSRAAVSWANAHRLRLLGLPTPKPLALLETRWLGLRGKAYFITEYVDAPDLGEYLRTTTDKIARASVVKAVVQLCYRLSLLQISHGDLKASNIKVMNGVPVLIDLDSMQQHRYAYWANRAHVKDIQRLMQNWKDDASLYNAFVKSFKVVYAEHTPLMQANLFQQT